MAVKIWLFAGNKLAKVAFVRLKFQVNVSNMSLHVSFYIKGTVTKVTLEVFLPLVNVLYVTLEIAI